MLKLVNKLHIILNEVKGFITGYKSSVPNIMIVNYNDDYYMLELTKLKPIEITDKLRKEYLFEKTTKEDEQMIIMSEMLKTLEPEAEDNDADY